MIEKEFEGGRFPDKRLARRLTKIAVKTAQDPRASFPQIARSDAELEAIYRFLSNSRVRMGAILEPHRDATLARMARCERVAVVHDSTQFAFRNDVGERLGYLPGPGQRGIMGHFALAVDGRGAPLGVLGIEALTPPPPKPRKQGRKHRLYSRTSLQRLAARWTRLVAQVRQDIAGKVSVVHLMDREADSYELMLDIMGAGEAFVIRLRHRDRIARSASEDGTHWRPVENVAMPLASCASERFRSRAELTRRSRRTSVGTPSAKVGRRSSE